MDRLDNVLMLIFLISKVCSFIFVAYIITTFISNASTEQLVKFITAVVSVHYLTWLYTSK